MYDAEDLRQQAVVRHREPDARLRDDHGDDHGSESEQRAPDHPGRQPRQLRMRFQSHHERGRVIELLEWHQARHHARHQDIEHRANGETAQYADWHAALWVLGFLRDGRHAVEADVGEKDDGRGLQDGAQAELAEGAGVLRYVGNPVVRVYKPGAERDHGHDDENLDGHDDGVDRRGLLDSPVAQRRRRADDDDGGQVRDRPRHMHLIAHVGRLERRRTQGGRNEVDAEMIQQLDEVTAPTYRYRGARHHVFQDQIPAYEPGDELAQGRVAVGVGAARNRHHGGKFRIAQAGEHAADPGDDKGKDDGGAGMFSRREAREHEYPGADDAADAEGDQRRDAQCSDQSLIGGFLLIGGNRLGGEHPP